MTRPYNERRNRQIFVLVNRRDMPPKEVPAEMLRLGFHDHLTYDNVRKILQRIRRCHKMSQKTCNLLTPKPID